MKKVGQTRITYTEAMPGLTTQLKEPKWIDYECGGCINRFTPKLESVHMVQVQTPAPMSYTKNMLVAVWGLGICIGIVDEQSEKE